MREPIVFGSRKEITETLESVSKANLRQKNEDARKQIQALEKKISALQKQRDDLVKKVSRREALLSEEVTR